MKTKKEYHYVYYSYEEYGKGYFGSRTCKCLPEKDIKYFGSFKDKTFKPTQKIILKDDYATREEAYADEIILQRYYKVVENAHFANRAYQTSTKFYYVAPTEKARENGKKGIKTQMEFKLGLFSLTKEKRSENGKKYGKMGGNKTKENKTGIFGRSKEKMSQDNKKGGKVATEKQRILGIGLFGITNEQRSETTRKTNYQKWMCLETGFVTNAGNLSRYQMKRGIDTSKRIRIE